MAVIKGLEWTFDTVASTYEKFRPSYVQELYKAIFDYIPIDQTSKVVEVGIGGGQATLPILQMDSHTALPLLMVNIFQLTFANDSVTNHDCEQLAVCDGIGVKVTIRDFWSVDIFIIMTDSGVILKILIELVAHLPSHRFERNHDNLHKNKNGASVKLAPYLCTYP